MPLAYTELHRDEHLVLAAALRVMMMADGQLTPQELAAVAQVSVRLGLTERTWRVLWNEATRVMPTEEAVKEAAAALERPEAREVVYQLLYEIASSDEIDDREWDLLEWLDEAWHA